MSLVFEELDFLELLNPFLGLMKTTLTKTTHNDSDVTGQVVQWRTWC